MSDPEYRNNNNDDNNVRDKIFTNHSDTNNNTDPQTADNTSCFTHSVSDSPDCGITNNSICTSTNLRIDPHINYPITAYLIASDNKTDLDKPIEIPINSFIPTLIDNEYFQGKVLFKHRLTHIHNNTDSNGNSIPKEWPYNRFYDIHKKLQFEFAFQGKFKQENNSIIYLGAELGDSNNAIELNYSFMKKTLMKILLNIINSVTPNMHYSFGNNKINELPHISFPLTKVIDRLEANKLGEILPTFGIDMFEGKINKKEIAPLYIFDPDKIYSFSFFSNYLDLINWVGVNIPGIPDQQLTNFWFDNPIRFVGYMVKDINKPHTHDNKQILFGIKVVHQKYCKILQQQ
jgi:hypothetical protein